MNRVAITCITEEPMIRAICGRVRRVHEVHEMDDVLALVSEASPCRLEVIAHSDRGVLRLPGWTITGDDAGSVRLRELPVDALAEIWLLGCATAALPEGKAAMRSLAAMLRADGRATRVYGATTMLGVDDYDEDGFARAGLTIEAANLW